MQCLPVIESYNEHVMIHIATLDYVVAAPLTVADKLLTHRLDLLLAHIPINNCSEYNIISYLFIYTFRVFISIRRIYSSVLF